MDGGLGDIRKDVLTFLVQGNANGQSLIWVMS